MPLCENNMYKLFNTSMIVSLSLLSVGACGEDSSSSEPDAFASCTTDSRAMTYLAGMSVIADDGMKLVLRSATPEPPARFDNVWSVQTQDDQGQPLASTALRVAPYMPDHGHGTQNPPLPVAGSEVGVFDMGPFEFWMPGVWEMHVEFDHDGMTSKAVLTFCIDE